MLPEANLDFEKAVQLAQAMDTADKDNMTIFKVRNSSAYCGSYNIREEI